MGTPEPSRIILNGPLTFASVPSAPQPRSRHSLKTMLSWAVQRNIFYQERDRIRAQFEANAVLTQPGQISSAIAAGEATLAEYSHPDPYTVPTAYGGSKYARNPPVPGEMEVVNDFGRESYVVPGKH